MKRDTSEIIEHFLEQLKFLNKSCAEFDSGDESEAKRISVTLRNILKDTDKDTSILKLLNKKGIAFLDTSSKAGGISNFIISKMQNCTVTFMNIYMGLVVKEITGINGEYFYHFRPLLIQPTWENKDLMLFDNWYNQIIFSDVDDGISRKKLILSIAEQDGGNHFDIKINNQYHKFKQKDSLKLNVNGQVITFENNPAFVSLRQIAREVIESIMIDKELAKLLN